MLHLRRRLLRPAAGIAALGLSLTPLAAAAAPDPASRLANLPDQYQQRLGNSLDQIEAARTSGDASYLANAQAIYEHRFGAIFARVSAELTNARARLSAHPQDTTLQAEVAGLQEQFEDLLAAHLALITGPGAGR